MALPSSTEHIHLFSKHLDLFFRSNKGKIVGRPVGQLASTLKTLEAQIYSTQKAVSTILEQDNISEKDQEELVESSLAIESALHSLETARKTYWISEVNNSSWPITALSWVCQWMGHCIVSLDHDPIDTKKTMKTIEKLVQQALLKSFSHINCFTRNDANPYLMAYAKKAFPIDVSITGRGIKIAETYYHTWQRALLHLQQPTPEEALHEVSEPHSPESINVESLSTQETLYWLEKVERNEKTSYFLSLQKKDSRVPSRYEIQIKETKYFIDLKDGSHPLQASTVESLHEAIGRAVPGAIYAH